MMMGLAITSRGLEETASMEIKELISSKTDENKCAVLFYPKSLEDFCLLCYKSQSVSRVLFLLDYFEFKADFFKILESKIKKMNLTGLSIKNKAFAVKCERAGIHNFTSMDVEKKSSECIIKKINQNKEVKIKVSLENPDIVFYICICDDSCYMGIDLCGLDLSKRDYRIFTSSSSLKGNIAYSLLRFSDYKKTDILLDPFSDSGEIAIEAALFSAGISPNYYRKNKLAFLNLNMFKKINFENFFRKADEKIPFKSRPSIYSFSSLLNALKSSQKNAKIAGVNKYINLSKVSVDWLDTKFDKGKIDKIITKLPSYSKRVSCREADKIYNEFFYQAGHILKKTGRVGVLLRNKIPEEIPSKYGLKLLKEKEVFSGKQRYYTFVYANNNSC